MDELKSIGDNADTHSAKAFAPPQSRKGKEKAPELEYEAGPSLGRDEAGPIEPREPYYEDSDRESRHQSP